MFAPIFKKFATSSLWMIISIVCFWKYMESQDLFFVIVMAHAFNARLMQTIIDEPPDSPRLSLARLISSRLAIATWLGTVVYSYYALRWWSGIGS
ncbi:MAG: hypothetical protein P8P99_01980 [Maricaulis sp.]|jgi:hypothetical protein|nr:hypothetical protein [Maricaulis sp.]